MTQNFKILLLSAALASWIAGCATLKAPPSPAPATASPQIKSDLKTQLEGRWESPGHDHGLTKRMTFQADGTILFEDGLTYLNPARWELLDNQHELRLTFPQAEDTTLQVFLMYRGDGVKSVDRAQKEVTYIFNSETYALNIAGWIYSKTEIAPSSPAPEAEPVLK